MMDTKCAAALPFPGIYIKLAVLCELCKYLSVPGVELLKNLINEPD